MPGHNSGVSRVPGRARVAEGWRPAVQLRDPTQMGSGGIHEVCAVRSPDRKRRPVRRPCGQAGGGERPARRCCVNPGRRDKPYASVRRFVGDRPSVGRPGGRLPVEREPAPVGSVDPDGVDRRTTARAEIAGEGKALAVGRPGRPADAAADARPQPLVSRAVASDREDRPRSPIAAVGNRAAVRQPPPVRRPRNMARELTAEARLLHGNERSSDSRAPADGCPSRSRGRRCGVRHMYSRRLSRRA